MSEVHVVLCQPAPLGSAEGIPGSVRIKADCGHQIWVAPSGMQVVLDPTIRTETKCLNCISPEQLKELVEERKIREVPGGREEAAAIIGDERVDAIYTALRAKRLGE